MMADATHTRAQLLSSVPPLSSATGSLWVPRTCRPGAGLGALTGPGGRASRAGGVAWGPAPLGGRLRGAWLRARRQQRARRGARPLWTRLAGRAGAGLAGGGARSCGSRARGTGWRRLQGRRAGCWCMAAGARWAPDVCRRSGRATGYLSGPGRPGLRPDGRAGWRAGRMGTGVQGAARGKLGGRSGGRGPCAPPDTGARTYVHKSTRLSLFPSACPRRP